MVLNCFYSYIFTILKWLLRLKINELAILQIKLIKPQICAQFYPIFPYNLSLPLYKYRKLLAIFHINEIRFLISLSLSLYNPTRCGSRTVVPSGRSARRPPMCSAHRAPCCPHMDCLRLGQISRILPWAMDSVAQGCLAGIVGVLIR